MRKLYIVTSVAIGEDAHAAVEDKLPENNQAED
jgi:hypothetical protein